MDSLLAGREVYCDHRCLKFLFVGFSYDFELLHEQLIHDQGRFSDRRCLDLTSLAPAPLTSEILRSGQMNVVLVSGSLDEDQSTCEAH